MKDAHLSTIDFANLLAGHAVAEAEGFLAERRDADAILSGVCDLRSDLDLLITREAVTPEILEPVRLLLAVLLNTARADSGERRGKWRRVLAGLTDLVRHESLALRDQTSGDPA